MGMKLFKIRASQLHRIMGKPKDSGGLTAKQAETLKDLIAKGSKSKQVQELTEKRDRPEGLSAGAKTYCKEWLRSEKLNRYPEISNKYLEKGNLCENQAIRLLNDVYLESYEKNTVREENEYMTGECDILAKPVIRDTKCSWGVNSFPMFDEKPPSDYVYQIQQYLILYDCSIGYVDFVLVDTPHHLIINEAKRIAFRENRDLDEVIQEQMQKNTYGDIKPELRVKSFEVSRDYELGPRIKEKVQLCRDYIKKLENE